MLTCPYALSLLLSENMGRQLLKSCLFSSNAVFSTWKWKQCPFHLDLRVNHTGCLIAGLRWCEYKHRSRTCLGSPILPYPYPNFMLFIPLGCWPCRDIHLKKQFLCVCSPPSLCELQKAPQKIPLKLLSLMYFLYTHSPHMMGPGTIICHLLKFPVSWASLIVTVWNASKSTLLPKLRTINQPHKLMFLSIHRAYFFIEDTLKSWNEERREKAPCSAFSFCLKSNYSRVMNWED